MHSILPISKKEGSDWGYAGIPIAGPLIGGALAGLFIRLVF
jgi:glycerol uptake facilitator protein